MPAQLMALTEGPSILLDKPILLLGRHPECDIQIDSRKVSRRHCCIAQVADYLVVRDLGSTNGIRVNGVRVLEGKLRAGDELTIGNYRYQVRWDALPVPTPRQRVVADESEQTVRAGSVDEDLESCDEPVALDEPASSDVQQAPPAVEVPRAIPRGDGRILPEHIDLAPGSDIYQRPSHPPSH